MDLEGLQVFCDFFDIAKEGGVCRKKSLAKPEGACYNTQVS